MLTVETLYLIAQSAFENDEWFCLVDDKSMAYITKFNSENEIDELLKDTLNLFVANDIDGEPISDDVYDNNTGKIYVSADHAKDWNYFKNTMLV